MSKPKSDIIDNRNETLAENIKRILGSTESARFAVGYFFLSGFLQIADKLENIKELKLLIGNTSNKETIEQIAEGYRRLEQIKDKVESQQYPEADVKTKMVGDAAENIASNIEFMDQTDENEKGIKLLLKLVEEKRLKVRIYTKGTLHAKAYIFNYRNSFYDQSGNEEERDETGIAIIGSSNLSISGVCHNTELNVKVRGYDNHDKLVTWFETLWAEAKDFDKSLMNELKRSWAKQEATPYDIYMKTLYEIVQDQLLEEEEDAIKDDGEDLLLDDLADFQRAVLNQAFQIINDYNGVFISDVVGLGKSFIGAAIIKHFKRTQKMRPLIICPPALEKTWEEYNEKYELDAKVLSVGMLQSSDASSYLEKDNNNRNFILVDESHKFRYPETQSYQALQAFLSKSGRKCCFLTATPRNKSPWDIYHQIKLFHQNDKTDIQISPPDLKEYFKLIEQGKNKLPELLSHLLIRRTRSHIIKWYGYDEETGKKVDPMAADDYLNGRKRAYIKVGGRNQFFPKRRLKTVSYSIEETYNGLYDNIRKYINKPKSENDKHKKSGTKAVPPVCPADSLSYARYGLWHYVKEEKRDVEPYKNLQQSGANLQGLIRILLFKRFESSVYAFRKSIERFRDVHKRFLDALDNGIIPAGDKDSEILYEPSAEEESAIVDALKELKQTYMQEDFNIELLKEHIRHDIRIFEKIFELVKDITPDKDAKLQTLLKELKREPLNTGKRLIFTEYADTARYLFDNLKNDRKLGETEVIFSQKGNKLQTIYRFAPKSNPALAPKKQNLNDNDLFGAGSIKGKIDTLIATDVLSEGQNLQDCDKVINYDLHWNPVRLIQRFGRIDRIGSDFNEIYGFNFLPEKGIEKNLNLQQKLKQRIAEIHETIGEDSAILEPFERLNDKAMYAIYQENQSELESFEAEDDLISLNEIIEFIRKLQLDDPAEFDRIKKLRNGIRSASYSDKPKGLYVFMRGVSPESEKKKSYQKLFILNDKGEVIEDDLQTIINSLKRNKDDLALPLPDGYNQRVELAKRIFSEDLKRMESERNYSATHTKAQGYVLRQLGIYNRNAATEIEKKKINELNNAFNEPLSKDINKELGRIRKEGLAGAELLKQLEIIYKEKNMKDIFNLKKGKESSKNIPLVVCSELLV